MALGLVGLAVFLSVGLGSYYLQPLDHQTLYSGLGAQDVSRIGAALERGRHQLRVKFRRYQGDGASRGQLAQARMLLAEKGLPSSANAGYELFDKPVPIRHSTPFMQEVTCVRAIEGELARTIQAMKGIKAVRSHRVCPKPARSGVVGNLRRLPQS